MEHHLAQHAGDELGHVVRLPVPMHDDALEILRAAGARKAEIVLHRDTGWNYSIAMNRDADNLADVQWIAERVNDFAAPDVINLVCRAVVCGDWLSPLLAG